MTNQGEIFSFRLRVRRDRETDKRWLIVPLEISHRVELAMVPNTVAVRSVITPPALQLLREAGLTEADLIDLETRRQEYVLRDIHLAGRSIPDFTVQVREVEGLRTDDGQYLVDGYLGLDVLLGLFSQITLDTQRLEITLQLRT